MRQITENSPTPNKTDKRPRCGWVTADPDYIQYHDQVWGVPVHEDRTLFEFLILEGAQAGLSWITILKRQEGYRAAFAGFDPDKVAGFSEKKTGMLAKDPRIIRNRLKIASAVSNARAFLKVQETFGSFDHYAWQFVDGTPVINTFKEQGDVPAATPLSRTFSKDLKQRGFSFVGPTIVYAFMQAVGMVNDHLVTCFRHKEVQS